ncbi:succinate dehydrogenase, cytochrome b556 subunit [Methylothermus subterraneus]
MDLRSSRPLSPHLQVYRLPLTAWLSISHRITGVILSFGLLVLVALLLAVPNPPRYEAILGFLRGWVGRAWLWLWILALFVHFCHGIRHLLWDLGFGLERAVLLRHSRWELGVAVALTLITTLGNWLT